MLTHALYDKSASRSIVYLASVCDLTQRASVSMRKCADWVNLKFVYIAYLKAHLHRPITYKTVLGPIIQNLFSNVAVRSSSATVFVQVLTACVLSIFHQTLEAGGIRRQ